MTFLDLFAGVGGFRRGMELAGHKCVGFCEWDRFATASYTSMHLITEEQRKYLATLDKKARLKEILKEEYRNGEWYSNDIRNVYAGNVPQADCWCFGAPCQDFSVAGHRAGMEGDRSSLVREVFRILKELPEENRPEWLIYENVLGMLSSNKGWDYLAILSEMDEGGYDAEWQVFNSKYHGVPQNRERVYTIGHLRRFGPTKILPITGTDGENCYEIKQIGEYGSDRKNPNHYRVYDPDGIAPTLNTMAGGGREPHIAEAIPSKFGIDYNEGGQCAQTLDTSCNQGTVEVIEGTAPNSEHPGQYVTLEDGVTVWAVWYEKYQCYIAIRKLTPRECFRLQGWSDEYFERAEFVNSDSQLYKEAGNGVTVNVVYEIAKEMKRGGER